MFAVVLWVVFGWVAGAVAMRIVPPAKPVEGWQTIAVGVAGSIVGGTANGVMAGEPYAPAGILWSIAGAVAIVAAWRWYVEA